MTTPNQEEVETVATMFAVNSGRKRATAVDLEMAADAIKTLDEYRAAKGFIPDYMEDVEVHSRFGGELEVLNDYGMVEQTNTFVTLYRLKEQETGNE